MSSLPAQLRWGVERRECQELAMSAITLLPGSSSSSIPHFWPNYSSFLLGSMENHPDKSFRRGLYTTKSCNGSKRTALVFPYMIKPCNTPVRIAMCLGCRTFSIVAMLQFSCCYFTLEHITVRNSR